MTTLGELTEAKVEQSGPPPDGEFTYIDISSIDNKTKRIVEPKRLEASAAPSRARQRLRAGDVLVSMTRPNLNAVAMVPPGLDGAIGSTGFHVLRRRGDILPQWLYYGVQTRDFVGTMSELVQGALYPAVRPKDIRAFQLNAPAPEVQRRVVAEIEKQFSRLDEAVVNLDRVNVNLKHYKAAVLGAAVTGRLVTTEAELAQRHGLSYETGDQLLRRILDERGGSSKGERSNKEPASVDETTLPKLPIGWCWATLDQIGQKGRPIIYGIIKPGPHVPDGVPYVRVTEMKDGVIDAANLRRTSAERARKFARATLAAGDLLISKDGTIGRVAVVPPALAGANITQHVMRVPIVAQINRNYVVWAIRSEFCQRWLSGETKGVALRGVNVEDFRRLPIPLPPLAEQVRIAEEIDRRLSLVFEVEREVQASEARAAALRAACLAKNFQAQDHASS